MLPSLLEGLGGVLFNLDAWDEHGGPVIDVSPPMTLTVAYDENDLAPGVNEDNLEIYRYDTLLGDWVALSLIERDTAANTITVSLDHFSEFALFAPTEIKIYLPLLLKG